MSDLTLQQYAVLGFCARYIEEHGRAPVLREIAEGTGLNGTTVAWRVVQELEDAGKLRTRAGKSRSIELLEHVPGVGQ